MKCCIVVSFLENFIPHHCYRLPCSYRMPQKHLVNLEFKIITKTNTLMVLIFLVFEVAVLGSIQFAVEPKRNSGHIVNFLRKNWKAKLLNYFSATLKYRSYLINHVLKPRSQSTRYRPNTWENIIPSLPSSTIPSNTTIINNDTNSYKKVTTSTNQKKN